jgi:hypothetical protein
MEKYIYPLIFCTLLQFSTFSQPYTELGTLKFQKYSANQNEANEYSAAVFIPIETKKNNYLIFGGGYNKVSLKNSLNQPIISNFGAISIQLGRVVNLDHNRSLTVIMIQKISSDFEDLSKKDYQIGTVGFITKQLYKHVKYKLGLFYNQEFWGPQIFPILGFDIITSNKLRFFGLLPRMITLEYQISKSGYLGFKFNMKRTSYRLAQQYAHGYVQEFKIETQGYIDYYLSDVLTLFGTFGYAPIRKYKIFDTTELLSQDNLAEFDNQIMAQVGLAIRIRSEN